MVDLIEELERKLEIRSKLRKMLGADAEVAEKDGHAHRIPRPCGLTIHTGLGCKFGCIYCYIYDMGFTFKPKPYHLTGLQLAYAVASNPSIVLGLNGTPVAFGSITEPFMKETADKAIEYMKAISNYLGNPIQFSTKAHLREDLCSKISSIEDRVSALITIVTLKAHGILEPGAPSPDERFESIRNLSKMGVHTILFMRPILPKLTDLEAEEILSRALDAGVRGVIIGSMRVTPGIIDRLKQVGYQGIEEILSRIPGKLEPRKQTTLKMDDLKKVICRLAEKLDMKVYPSACAANIEAHGLSCNACRLGPCGDLEELPSFELEDVLELANRYNLRVIHSVLNDHLKLKVSGDWRRIREFTSFLRWSIKRRILVRKA